MQKTFLVFLFIIQIFFVNTVIIARSHTAIAKKIKAEIEKTNPNANIGIKIRNLQTDQIVYEQNSDRYYTFASSLKFISIVAMQQYFGDDYKFISQISKKGHDYYLSINDPDFSSIDLNSLILKLKKQQADNIKGNFYIIKNEFSLPKTNENHMKIDSIYCYGAPVSRIHIDKNCIKVAIATPGELGEKITIWQPASSPYEIINEAIIIADGQKPRIFSSVEGDYHYLKGSFHKSTDKYLIVAVASDNYAHLALVITKLLKDNNIHLSGKILSTEKPENATLIVSVEKTFAQVAAMAMKQSDDFITDYFVAQFADDHGVNDWFGAGDLLKQYTQQLYGIDLTKTVLADGSGLSRYNLLSVNNFDNFLSAVYHSEAKEQVLELMAKPNEAGTLRNRGKDLKLFAKTGTMTGISSIVGYVFDDQDVPYSFVIVTNSFIGKSKPFKIMEENIIRAIVEQ